MNDTISKNNVKFRITVKLYEDLIKYKDFFSNAIKMYFDHAIGKFSCDYNSGKRKVTTRLKIDCDAAWYEELYNLIKEKELEILNQQKGGKNKVDKINETALINNIMSTLLGVKQYNLTNEDERK